MKMSEVDFDLTNVHINTKSGAQHAITEMETVIGKVSEARSSLGALQTRIAPAATVGEVSAENASESNSRRLDLDYASETAKNVKEKIISQVNLSVQAQCNTSAQLLLKLL
jgi:flagellin